MDTPRLHAIFAGRDRTPLGRLARTAFGAASPLYRTAIQARNLTFDRGWRRAASLGRPTVSVGNLTAGGTGKTPMVIELVRRLVDRGHRPAVLLRGYFPRGSKPRVAKGSTPYDMSDEAQLYRFALHGLAVAKASPDRRVAARNALLEKPDTTVFILDDAFQRRQVRRDLDLVLIDATNPFGYGHVLPRGLLREPPRNLRRAHGVIVTRADQVTEHERQQIDQQITDLIGRPATAHAAHRWTALLDADDQPLPLSHLKSQRVLGVCGIGNPESFARHLAEHAGSLATARKPGEPSPDRLPGVRALNDHHAYRHDELTDMLREAELRQADAIVTTEKDWVKWRPLLADHPLPLPVLRPVLAMRFLDGEAAVDTLLEQLPLEEQEAPTRAVT
ncbi:MAG: tetraacyldisaccharide 4'-kinase [Phycisphaeraceae bacterium]